MELIFFVTEMLSADSNNAEIWGLDIMLVPAVKLTFWKMSLTQTISAPATAGPSTVPYADMSLGQGIWSFSQWPNPPIVKDSC